MQTLEETMAKSVVGLIAFERKHGRNPKYIVMSRLVATAFAKELVISSVDAPEHPYALFTKEDPLSTMYSVTTSARHLSIEGAKLAVRRFMDLELIVLDRDEEIMLVG